MGEKSRKDNDQYINGGDCASQASGAAILPLQLHMDPETWLMETTFRFRRPLFKDYSTTFKSCYGV